MTPITISSRKIGRGHPTYIIAEVGSNFDGDLWRAKLLAKRAKEAGADAYKIQNFLASRIVSEIGFKSLQISFQSAWDRPVVEMYRQAEFPREWLEELSQHCREIGIDFLSSPYDKEAVDFLEKINVPAYKIGSGEIDNLEFLEYVANTGKPVILGVGSATMEEIEAAVLTVRHTGNEKIVLLQCVTNYPSPVADANIRAMDTIRVSFGVEVGYSDHTIGVEGKGDDPLDGLLVPLAAVARGASVIEKHFTDDRTRRGPDHPFAMDMPAFAKMVTGIRALEQALGDGRKRVMPSENETVVIQRRGIYATVDIPKGSVITRAMFEFLRPAVGLRPSAAKNILGKRTLKDIAKGASLTQNDVEF